MSAGPLLTRYHKWAQSVKEKARALGFDAIGIAAVTDLPEGPAFLEWIRQNFAGEMHYMVRDPQRRLDPRRVYPPVQRVIVVARNYYVQPPDPALLTDPSRGRISRYAWGLDYHEILRPRLFQLDAHLRELSGRTEYAKAYVDTGPVLERAWAVQAGLGFIGKNTCLIHPRLGSYVFLGVLLVPEPLEPDSPPHVSATPRRWEFPSGDIGTCGACTRCLDTCPTHAFTAPYILDARRCISYLTIELRGPIPRDLRPLMKNWIFGCDECQEVCPWNSRFAHLTDEPAFQPRPDQVAPRLLDLIRLDEREFRRRYRKTPIYRAKRRGLLRNVCVALGNWGAPESIPALSERLNQEPDPIIRGHAAWALGRIGTREGRNMLDKAWQRETDPYVREEIACALESLS